MTLQRHFVAYCVLLCCTTTVWAAPILRLNGAKLLPIWVQTGADGPTTTVIEAYNIGDGSLNLQVSGNYPWLTPAVGAAAKCSFDASKTCLPIKVLFDSASLAEGTYTGLITINDPNAFDTPQTIPVKIYVGGNVPARVDFYLPPNAGAEDSATFQTPGGPVPVLKATTQSGGPWLAVSSSGMGSFQFLYTHAVQAKVRNGMAAGDYNGSVAVSNSAFAADNKSVPVVLHVTAQPIAKPSAEALNFTVVQGAAAGTQTVSVANAGQGTLSVSGATAAGGDWLSAAVQSDGSIQVNADAGPLAAGFYTGSVTIDTNAANNPLTVPVEFEVQAVSPPLAFFGGVVDAASFTSPVAAGALASLFGSQMASGVAFASSVPLPTTLADAVVKVGGTSVPLIYASPGQINFQMPFEASGTAAVWVELNGQRGNTITVPVARRAAGFYFFPGTNYGIAQNATRNNGFPVPDIPAFAAIPKAPARICDVLVFYGSGFGPVNPPVATGAAAGAKPLSTVTGTPQVVFHTAVFRISTVPDYIGFTPSFVGLYQLNVRVPDGVVPNPAVPVQLIWPDGSTSNTVVIAVESK
ncbi:MAG: hypothetical protein HY236_01010 [Acidobacteria bacterium]|nr:hypothetical protein [Acidobacteriota bacterium]